MFWDEEYIDEKIEDLKDMIENDTFDVNRCNNFISDSDLEDEFSHNEIGEAQEMFKKEARKYLSENHSGKYAMWSDWSVHIATVDLYRDIMWKNNKHGEDYIKTRESRDIVI